MASEPHNMRDLGGMRTADGYMVRYGQVFRSGDLAGASADENSRLRQIGIRWLVDLRSRSEREARPFLWREPLGVEAWVDASETSSASLSALIASAETSRDDLRAAMARLSAGLPFSHAGSYATLFRWLAAGRVPLLFNCAAGKDRTGVAAALLLWSLGVEREAIMADYLRSNDAVARLRVMAERHYAWDAGSSKVQAVLTADPAYLEAMFDAVIDRCGGIQAYVETVLGLDGSARAALRENLLCD